MQAFAQRQASAVYQGADGCEFPPRVIVRLAQLGFVYNPILRPGGFLYTLKYCSRAGQSLIESCLVIAILCLVLFGGIQISQLYLTREILDYAASSGARARAVGLNDFMVRKTVQLASVSIAGAVINPHNIPVINGPSRSFWLSQTYGAAWDWAATNNPIVNINNNVTGRFMSYLEAESDGELPAILDTELAYLDRYGQTNTVKNLREVTDVPAPIIQADAVGVTVNHQAPLNFIFHRAFFADDVDAFSETSYFENHAALYLQ